MKVNYTLSEIYHHRLIGHFVGVQEKQNSSARL